MWIKDTWEESMACRAKPVLLQSKLASCMAGMHIVRDVLRTPRHLCSHSIVSCDPCQLMHIILSECIHDVKQNTETALSSSSKTSAIHASAS